MLWKEMETAPDLAALDALVPRVKLLPEGLRAELRSVYAERKNALAATGAKPDPFAVIDNAPPPPGPDEDAVNREVRDLIKLFATVKGTTQMVKLVDRWKALRSAEAEAMRPYVAEAAKRTGYEWPAAPDPADYVRF